MVDMTCDTSYIILLRCVTLELLRAICLQEPRLVLQTSDDAVCSKR